MFIVQAITTKYIGPSNVRGSRIKAKAAAGSITIHYDNALSSEQAHAAAAKALAKKFGWNGRYFQGGMPDDSGYCFVCTGNKSAAFSPAFVIEASGEPMPFHKVALGDNSTQKED